MRTGRPNPNLEYLKQASFHALFLTILRDVRSIQLQCYAFARKDKNHPYNHFFLEEHAPLDGVFSIEIVLTRLENRNAEGAPGARFAPGCWGGLLKNEAPPRLRASPNANGPCTVGDICSIQPSH